MMLDQINVAIYQAMLKGSHRTTKYIPQLDFNEPPGMISQRLSSARRNLRSPLMADFLISLYSSLFFTEEIPLLINSKVTLLVEKTFHKNFTSLEELYRFLQGCKRKSIFKDICLNLLLLIPLTQEIPQLNIQCGILHE